MNRRSFIATLTAIAGAALARVKAPVAPKYVAACDPALGLDESVIHVQRVTPWVWDENDHRHYAETFLRPLKGRDLKAFKQGHIKY